MRGFRTSMIALSLALMAASGWRWHEHAVSAPARLQADSAAGFILVANERDCAESRAWLAHWIRPLLDRDVPVRVALVGTGGSGPDEIQLGGGVSLPRTRAVSERRVERALLRAGVTRTPALILLGEEGAPTLVRGLHHDHPSSIESVSRLLAELYRHETSIPDATRRPL